MAVIGGGESGSSSSDLNQEELEVVPKLGCLVWGVRSLGTIRSFEH